MAPGGGRRIRGLPPKTRNNNNNNNKIKKKKLRRRYRRPRPIRWTDNCRRSVCMQDASAECIRHNQNPRVRNERKKYGSDFRTVT